jgi:proteasome lid subunit RPN8/RPN11
MYLPDADAEMQNFSKEQMDDNFWDIVQLEVAGWYDSHPLPYVGGSQLVIQVFSISTLR